MTTIYNRIQCNFTQVSNKALLDPNLSAKAYKLYAYMCYRIGTFPEWEFNKTEILKHFKEGEKALRIAFNELIAVGFLIRKQGRAARGKFAKIDYEIFAEPVITDSAPQAQNRRADKRQAEKRRAVNASLNNKERNNKELINKDFIFLDEKEKKVLIDEFWKKEELQSDQKKFFLHYETKGWKGVKNWQAAAKYFEEKFNSSTEGRLAW